MKVLSAALTVLLVTGCVEEITITETGSTTDSEGVTTPETPVGTTDPVDSETPVVSTPGTSTPVVTTPVTSTPVVTTPGTSTPVVTTPVTSTPVVETPVTSTPVVETPVTSTPVVETPVTSTPVVETPVTSTPVVETPVTSTPVVETPVTSTPVVETPVTSTPVVETPVTSTPVVETPVTSTPVVETPVTSTPVVETPVTSTPVVETPVTSTPVVETPVTSTPVVETPVTSNPIVSNPVIDTPSINGTFRINESGNLTKSGEVLPMNCVNWFGLEGQHEPKDAANNADGAPMELYMGNMWWANESEGTGRTVEQTMQEIVAKGAKVIRLPIAPQTLDATNEQGIGDIQNGGVLKNHESVRQDNARQAMTDFIIAADKYNLNVIIDIHSCSNYLGWRAGDLEAKPPYVDADREDYHYDREGYSCGTDAGSGVIVHEYNQEIWLDNLREIAGLSKELGVDNIIGVDIFNEPWNYTWSEWKTLAESAYGAISSVNDDMLIIVEGVSGGKADGTESEHGLASHKPNWGENLYGYAADPLNIPKDRLILSPHTYGPSVFVQNHFLDQSQEKCEGLDGDAAGEAGCDIVIDGDYLAKGWDEHFGYLREQGYAVLIGEFGGLMDWPLSAEPYYADLWSHASNTVDKEWQTALVDYMVDKKIEGCYWSLNPESADTGGLFKHAHSESNGAGWGEWLEFDADKIALVQRLWKGIENSIPAETNPVDTDPVEIDPIETEPVDTDPDNTAGTFRIDELGNLTKSGEVLPMNCVNWFGLEGQHEPKDAANNADGAPMELYMGNMWWANESQGTGRTVEQTMEEIVAQGVKVIRLPIAPQTLDATNEQGIGDIQNGGVLKNHESVRQDNARQAMTDFIIAADKYNLNVIIDIHSCSNYLGWRAGDLEAKPPYVDADREDYHYDREGYSCGTDVGNGVTVHEYNEEIWLDNLREIAGLSKELGVDNIIGVDIFNEPWNYTWSEWKTLAESAYGAISSVNDDMLIIVEGVSGSKADGTESEHGLASHKPNWGENLYGMKDDPLNIPKERLILSPHTYGPSVFVQNHFLDQSQEKCEGLDGDAAGEAGCNIVIDPDYLAVGWDEHFGYLREEGYAVLIGEFGGLMDWPLSAEPYYANLWSHASSTVDKEWQTALVGYMTENSIQGCYWSLNPESADTGGLFKHAHSESNGAGWGEWLEFDADKLSLLQKLWK